MMLATAARAPSAPPALVPSVIHGDAIADLVAFVQTPAQLVTAPLPWPEGDTLTLDVLAPWTHAMRVAVDDVVSPEQLEGLAPPQLPSAVGFLDRLAFAATVFADLVGATAVGVRVRVGVEPQCPRFHVDQVPARGVWVACGPGTEWLEDHAADRSRLGHQAGDLSDADSGLILDPNGLHAVGPNRLAVFKGELWSGNEGQSVIHRSPPSNGEPRLTATFDWLDA